jgi:PAS domain S-box-containing protein
VSILLITGISLALGLGINTVQDIRSHRNNLKNQSIVLSQIIGNYCAPIMDFKYESAAEDILSKLKTSKQVVGARLLNADGSFFYGYGDHKLLDDVEGKENSYFSEDYFIVSTPFYFKNRVYGYIQMAVSTSEIQAIIQLQMINILIILMLILVLAFFAARMVQKHLQTPIFNLIEFTDHISETEDYTKRITVQADDEMDHLYTSFNKMLVAIENRDNRIKDRESKFHNIFNSQHDAIFIHDVKGKIIDVNDTMLKMYRISRPEALKYSIVPDYSSVENDFTVLPGIWKKTMEGFPQEFEWKARRPCDGSTFDAQVNLRMLEQQGESVILATVRNITERKAMEKGMVESEAKFRNLIEQLQDAVFVERNNKLILVNDKFREMFGIGAEVDSDTVFHLENYISREDFEVYKDSISRLINGDIQHADIHFSIHPEVGRTRQIEASFTTIVIQNQLAFQGVLRDVTDKRNLEEQFRQSQKMEAVGRLAGGVAHDFNNILTVINGYCDMLLSREKLESKIKKPLAQIQKSGKRAARLTNKLLAFSRKQVLQPKNIDINHEFAELYSMLVRLIGEDIKIDLNFGDALHPIYIDLGQLEQIAINLIVNARDAMPEGGKLTIETRNISFDGTEMENNIQTQAGDFVMVAISDTGCGMDAKTMEKIFEPFFSTKGLGKGTGLGLSMIYATMNHVGGFITVYSEPGLGTTFKCYFPIAPELDNDSASEQVDTVDDTLNGRETIVIAEDNDDLRIYIQSIFQDKGYDIHLAQDGLEALDMIKNIPHIDLLLTDVVMPKLSGAAMADQVMKLYPNLKILFMSGYTGNELVQDKLGKSNVDFIQKPFSAPDLLKKIRNLLR